MSTPRNIESLRIGKSEFSFRNAKEFALIYKDIFLRNEYKFKADNDRPTFLDCGAHIGIATLYFKQLYPNSKITAFEPNPETFEILKLNVCQNNLEGVELVNAALAKTEGEADFFISKDEKCPWTWGDAAVKNKWYSSETTKTIKVPAVKLSSYIEGMEQLVLEEAADKLPLVKEIIMEFHGSSTNPSNRAEDILALLHSNKFEYTLKQDGKIINPIEIKKTDPYWLIIHAKRGKGEN